MSNDTQKTAKDLIPPAESYPHVYRAYSRDEKKMYTPDELYKKGIMIAPNGLLWSASGDKPEIKVLAYSGQKDSNKKPLFEGDICRVSVLVDLGIDIPSSVQKWAVMRWKAGAFTFHLPAVFGRNGAFSVTEAYIEGNEWENPELLDNLLI